MGGFAPQKYEHFALFDEESEKMQVAFLSLSLRYFVSLRSVALLFLIVSKRLQTSAFQVVLSGRAKFPTLNGLC
jgi:hypothetical protein